MAKAETMHFVSLAFAHLQKECRSLLSLLYLDENEPYEEIAGQLGMKVGSIGPKGARCFQSLRERVHSHVASQY